MKFLTLSKEKLYEGNLVLINARHALHSAAVNDLTAADPRFPDILIRRDAANVLRLILEKISAKNAIVPVSGYRSAAEQQALFDDSLKDNGEEFTRKYVALPNHSEHQTGLAIDLGLNQADIDFIRPNFPYEGICDAFRRTAPNYGFIERYAKGKEEITGIFHEPWHFRYVGYPHSKIMEENDLLLEEYVEFMKSFRENKRYVHHGKDGAVTEAYYVPAADGTTEIVLPDNPVCQISGNNVDGFIVTVWRK